MVAWSSGEQMAKPTLTGRLFLCPGRPEVPLGFGGCWQVVLALSSKVVDALVEQRIFA